MTDQTSLGLRSLVKQDGALELSLAQVAVSPPKDDEVIVRVEATPINPSDLGLLLAAADISSAKTSGKGAETVVTASIAPVVMRALAGRIGKSMPVGLEGAGVVTSAGASPEAQALIGKTVSTFVGGMYGQLRKVRAADCLVLPAGIKPEEAASAFVNPLTALGMVETARREGHKGLVHTAAASNLGQMLNRLCQADGIPLVNIVRNEEQVQILKGLGAKHIVNSAQASFRDDLISALKATGATLAFDAIGGGKLAGQILNAMEAVAAGASAETYNMYGSSVHKQVYVYGTLDPSPIELTRGSGMTWGIGGWLLFHFLTKVGPEVEARLKARVASEIRTTFASRYARTISLLEALDPDVIAAYGRRATGEKFLINPNLAVE
ncbi:zinc-binding dehydrogenase [Bradyrhizobium sp. KBS0727]|uniref:zinc-binding dehydrogenase n=1 Tax=unclassified Bradyrhizobium TaxID=2631580 RepID=UPI00110D3AB4|nr:MULTISPECIES: zinc-binding dehydrogenase [unclassified Bradyrhizobium]QDW38031.1 zinc-binding dehydrogenase [Bradyrhizobium sp. KBS0725]QDW44635.1 zinc-binding dehydrogenase [Bradyrhizobium sp. KBS0727]